LWYRSSCKAYHFFPAPHDASCDRCAAPHDVPCGRCAAPHDASCDRYAAPDDASSHRFAVLDPVAYRTSVERSVLERMVLERLASASDSVSMVVGTANPNAAASPRRENAPRREISCSLMLETSKKSPRNNHERLLKMNAR